MLSRLSHLEELTLSALTSVLLLLYLLIPAVVNAKIIHSERSLYRNIVVEDALGLRCLKFLEKQSTTRQSCFQKNEPQKLVFNYTKLLFAGLLINDHPQRILIIGLGGGTMSNTLHQLFPDSIIDNVEIDPAVVKVARNYFYFVENESVTTYSQDGRIFVKRALLKKQLYDWIILDAFNGEYIPEHLLTKEFLQETQQLLSKQGVLTSNTFSSSKLYAHESATYQAVFGDFYNVRDVNSNNRIIVASRQKQPNVNLTSRQLETLNGSLRPFNIDINAIHASMTSTKIEQDWPANTRILTDQFSPVNLLKRQ